VPLPPPSSLLAFPSKPHPPKARQIRPERCNMAALTLRYGMSDLPWAMPVGPVIKRCKTTCFCHPRHVGRMTLTDEPSG